MMDQGNQKCVAVIMDPYEDGEVQQVMGPFDSEAQAREAVAHQVREERLHGGSDVLIHTLSKESIFDFV